MTVATSETIIAKNQAPMVEGQSAKNQTPWVEGQSAKNQAPLVENQAHLVEGQLPKNQTPLVETIIAKNQAPMVEDNHGQESGTYDTSDDDGFFDLLSSSSKRCSLKLPGEKNGPLESENKENKPKLVSTPDSENFLDMVACIQGSRMNDQRASLPQFPGLNSKAVINQYIRERNVNDVPDDSFFEMLMRCQSAKERRKIPPKQPRASASAPVLTLLDAGVQTDVTERNDELSLIKTAQLAPSMLAQGFRIDNQRSALPHNRPAPSVPDEDFFGLIQKEQRTSLSDKDEISPPQQASVKKKQK
ncbi:hypothetical protein DPMN_147110 [Dreissena polymorpha]|uniref:Uncharacterized protein n=1 Tax=Dreissena polymorpha TaxID=45954 RepID=A0A9D4IZ13_DREPO|nr:hypothetical protein DPMN_147110 [Dreissena polymorpha]